MRKTLRKTLVASPDHQRMIGVRASLQHLVMLITVERVDEGYDTEASYVGLPSVFGVTELPCMSLSCVR